MTDTLQPYRFTFRKYGEGTIDSSFETETRAGALRAALTLHKAGSSNFKFQHCVNGNWVTDHDSQDEFEQKTTPRPTSARAVHSLMQLQHTANALHKHASKALLEPEHHYRLLYASLTAMRDAGITESQLMDMVYKAYPSVKSNLQKAYEQVQTVSVPAVKSGPLEELAGKS